MKTLAFLLHALSPLHVGTGQAADVIDLPIARMRSTGIPIVPGSSVRGVLRYARDPAQQQNGDVEKFSRTFGPEPAGPEDDSYAGALTVGDARLLALPVRSFAGTFAWVSSPLLLTLAARDLAGVAGLPQKIPTPVGCAAIVTPDSRNLHRGRVYLEDLDLEAASGNDPRRDEVLAWAKLLAPRLGAPGSVDLFTGRFLVVDDETMGFLWDTATQVDARIRLDPTTRTVAKGALWYEESLPPETLLLGVASATHSLKPGDRSRQGGAPAGGISADALLEFAFPRGEQILQFGGKAGIGRGRCRVVTMTEGGVA